MNEKVLNGLESLIIDSCDEIGATMASNDCPLSDCFPYEATRVIVVNNTRFEAKIKLDIKQLN